VEPTQPRRVSSHTRPSEWSPALWMEWTTVEAVAELEALRSLATSDTPADSPLALLRRTVRVAPLAGGLTNRLYVCEVQPEQQRWVVRAPTHPSRAPGGLKMRKP
jgi:hypothetical protein